MAAPHRLKLTSVQVFGKATTGPTAALPQHGFARTSKWELLGKIDESETSVQVDFGLGPENLTIESRKQWPFDFGLIYSVVLSKTALETKILVRNEGGVSFDFNLLFHTYLRVPVSVSNLQLEGQTLTGAGCDYRFCGRP